MEKFSFYSWHGQREGHRQIPFPQHDQSKLRTTLPSETQMLQYRQSWDPNQSHNTETVQPAGEKLRGPLFICRKRIEWQDQSHRHLHHRGGYTSGNTQRKGGPWLGTGAHISERDVIGGSKPQLKPRTECSQKTSPGRASRPQGEVDWPRLHCGRGAKTIRTGTTKIWVVSYFFNRKRGWGVA